MLLKICDHISQLILLLSFAVIISSCNGAEPNKVGVLSQKVETIVDIIVGAQNVAEYLPTIEGKKVAMVVNQTSKIDDAHIVDSLLKFKVDIIKIFAPEHGFRGEADAGEKVLDSKDVKTGIPVVSLYGKKKKPSKVDLEEVEVLIFDIQDVGTRFYTYISSLHYVMEACAEQNIPIIVLDRPNPNAHYIDGPVLEEEYKSFVGMHPVPVVYGMTIGEYAQMINGERWLSDGVQADLTVVNCRNYTHDTYYNLPVKPSPNLPNSKSIFLYPSLCFFEGTNVSVGRGTDKQFQIYGHPDFSDSDFTFTPRSMAGAKYPKHENKKCNGQNLQNLTVGSLHESGKLDLSYLLDSYREINGKNKSFFLDNNFFEKLAGTDQLRNQIIAGLSEEEIRKSWVDGIKTFRNMRSNYLIYE